MRRRHERSRPWHARRITPRATGQGVTDALRRAGCPCEKTAARAAVEIDHQIKMSSAKSPRQRKVISPSRETARPLDDDHFIDRRMMTHHRLSRGFDEIGDARVRKFPPQRGDRGRREDDVADQPETDQKNSQGSIVASSINITGMSSLIGYTR